MKISEMKKKLEAQIIVKHGQFRGRFILMKWRLQDWFDDLIIVGFVRDMIWWIFDGKLYWDDVADCGRKLCRYCGKKPF